MFVQNLDDGWVSIKVESVENEWMAKYLFIVRREEHKKAVRVLDAAYKEWFNSGFIYGETLGLYLERALNSKFIEYEMYMKIGKTRFV